MGKGEKDEHRRLKLRSAGGVIRILRKERGVSLVGLATKIGWDKSRLSRYETNKVALSADTIDQIAAALGLPPVVVVVGCLKHIYPALSHAASVPGKALDRIVREILAESEQH